MRHERAPHGEVEAVVGLTGEDDLGAVEDGAGAASHRDRGETAIAGDRDSVLREIEALKKAGATSVQVMPPKVATFEQSLEWIEWYDSEIIPKFR